MSLTVITEGYEKVDRRDVEKAKAHRRFKLYDTNKEEVGSFESSKFIDIIIAHTRLREIAQREDGLKEKLHVQRERIIIDRKDEKAKVQVQQLEEEMKSLQRKWWHQEQELHRAEHSIYWNPRDQYRTIRKDPEWYMVYRLVEDCAARGGCCGRECGCCRKRSASSQKRRGAGRCTVECECCIQFRGFELTEKEKKQTR